MTWQKSILLKTLNRLQRQIWNYESLQLAIIKVNDHIFAIENKCPHQGLSLENGIIDEEQCTLTCNWHHWQFNLLNGEALEGGANISTFKTKVENEYIWIDI